MKMKKKGMTPISLLCSRSAHAGTVRFEMKGGAPSTGAVGATWVPPLKEIKSKSGGWETASKLGRTI